MKSLICIYFLLFLFFLEDPPEKRPLVIGGHLLKDYFISIAAGEKK